MSGDQVDYRNVSARRTACDRPRQKILRIRYSSMGSRHLRRDSKRAATSFDEDTSVEDFDRLFAVNLRSPFFLVQQTLPILGNGSSIVMVSSLAAHAVVGMLAAYAATKGAIDTLVKHFAATLGPRGIRVNAVAHGVVDTDMSNFAKTDAGQKYTLNLPAIQRLARNRTTSAL